MSYLRPKSSKRCYSIKSVIQKDILLESNELPKNENDFSVAHINEINQMWDLLDRQIRVNKLKKNSDKNEHALNNLKRYKAIRIFVSSTFTDFFNEREILVKNVFPELREWCFKRNLDLIECDLRWGVPSDSTSDDTILTCLTEIDRCLQENDGQPFFIGLLGEKYGWVPDINKLSDQLKENYYWVPKTSITHMEFLHGALRCNNKNSCFFIRSKNSLKNIPAEYYDKFYETNTYSQFQLKILKEKLKFYHSDRVFEYNCKYDKIDDSTGRKKVKLCNLEEFGQIALDFLKKTIENFYPDLKPINYENRNEENEFNKSTKSDEYFNQEQVLQDLLIIEKTNFYIGYENEYRSILDYLYQEKLSENFELIYKDCNNSSKNKIKNLFILGDEGSGKTSLMALITKNLIQNNKTVFYHFYSASVNSRFSKTLLERFIYYFNKKKNLNEPFKFEITIDKMETIKSFNKILEMLDINEEVYILVDGYLNEKHWFDWIPRNHPNRNIKLIFTANKSDFDLIYHIIGDETWFKICLNNFDDKYSKDFIQKYLQKYNKKLDEKQINLILKKSNENKTPLWLSFVCEELRIFGEYTTVTKKIENMSIQLEILIKSILNRIISDYRENLVKEVLILLALSYNGIPENEICLLLNSTGYELNRMEWAQITRSLKYFLKFFNYQNTQLITLSDKKINKIIEDEYLGENFEKTIEYHKKIINFYKNFSKYRIYICSEICYHFKAANCKEEFVEFLKSEEAKTYINSSQRSFYFNILRCQFNNIALDNDGNILKMCFSCSNKIGYLSSNRLNKDSCFICGSFFTANNKKLFKCLKHNFKEQYLHLNKSYKCCICNNIYFYSQNKIINPVNAKCCSFCYAHICTKFSFET